jgi:alpha-L-fucosidase
MMLMDFANDDNFSSCWVSSPWVLHPWWKVDLEPGTPVSSVVVTEGPDCQILRYEVEVLSGGGWYRAAVYTVPDAPAAGKVHICRFPQQKVDAVRIRFWAFEKILSIAEVGVYSH